MADGSFEAASQSYPTNGTFPDYKLHRLNLDFPQRVALTIIHLMIGITGIIGNSIVILAIVVSLKLRSTHNWFLMNLAVVDLLTSLCIIFYAASYQSLSFALSWLFDIVTIVTYTCVATSLTTHALIAFTIWYLNTRNKAMSMRLFTTRNNCIMIALCWLLPIIVMIVIFNAVGLYNYKITPYLEAVFIIINFLVIATFYLKVWRFISRHGKRRMSNGIEPKLDRKLIAVTKNLLLILLAFILCFIPYASTSFYGVETAGDAYSWLQVPLFFNSCINPIIYAGRIRAFREVMGCIIRCQFGSIPMPTACLRRMRHTNQNEVQESSVTFTVSV